MDMCRLLKDIYPTTNHQPQASLCFSLSFEGRNGVTTEAPRASPGAPASSMGVSAPMKCSGRAFEAGEPTSTPNMGVIVPMTDPWCWYMNANMTVFSVDGIHVTIYSSTMDPMGYSLLALSSILGFIISNIEPGKPAAEVSQT